MNIFGFSAHIPLPKGGNTAKTVSNAAESASRKVPIFKTMLSAKPTALESSAKMMIERKPEFGQAVSPLGAKIVGPFKRILTEKSTIPEIIELEEKMLKMGYHANFADNLETGKIITNAYETMSQRGYKMPKEVILMEPTRKGILGFRPWGPEGKEFETPLLFNKKIEINKELENSPLKDIGINSNATDTPEGAIYHEIGHFLSSGRDIGKAIKTWHFKANDGFDIDLAKEVGFYAMTGDKFNSGGEFIAEVFAGIMDGKHYSKRVMDLYYELGGAKILNK